MSFLQKSLLMVIRFYRRIISPIIPARCRYYPTCSEYGVTAIKWHGGRRGGMLTIKRIARCHPLGGHGIDFVPLPLYQYQYTFVPQNPHYKNQESLGNIEYSRLTYPQDRGVYQLSNSYPQHLNLWLRQDINRHS